MSQARLSVPPPSKGKPIALVLIFLLLAVGAGLLTWALYPTPPEPSPSPPPALNPGPKLVELPIEEPIPIPIEEDAGDDADADEEEEAKAKRPRRRRAEPEGTIDKRQLSAFIRTKGGQVRQCYERRLKTNHMLQGVLLTQIRINSSGRVTNVSFSQDTLHDSSVRSCVASKISSWRFPSPEGGAVTVSTPFRFSPRLD